MKTKYLFPVFCVVLTGFSLFIILLSPVSIKIEVITAAKNSRINNAERIMSHPMNENNNNYYYNDKLDRNSKIDENKERSNNNKPNNNNQLSTVQVTTNNNNNNNNVLMSSSKHVHHESSGHVNVGYNNEKNFYAQNNSNNNNINSNSSSSSINGDNDTIQFSTNDIHQKKSPSNWKICRVEESSLNWRGDCVSSMDCPSNQFCYRRNGINLCRDICKKKTKNILLNNPGKIVKEKRSNNILESLKLFSSLSSSSTESIAKSLIPRKEDIWVVSYPKSGSTWVRHLITNLYRQVEFEKKHGTIGVVVKIDDDKLLNKHNNVSRNNKKDDIKYNRTTIVHYMPPRAATFDEVDRFIPFLEDKSLGPVHLQFLNKSYPRIFKSHQPYNCDLRPCNYFLGNQAKWQCECPNCAIHFKRIIYIVRDGRSVMRSYFHFRKELNHIAKGTTFETWLKKKRHYPGPSWGDHVLSWYNRLMEFNEKDYLWLQYEDMMKNPTNVIEKLLVFLNLTKISEEGIRRVAKLSSREEMQKLEAAKGAGFFAKRYRKRHKSFRMVHNHSSWRDIYDQRTMDYFMANNGDVMDCMGYK